MVFTQTLGTGTPVCEWEPPPLSPDPATLLFETKNKKDAKQGSNRTLAVRLWLVEEGEAQSMRRSALAALLAAPGLAHAPGGAQPW